MMATQAQHTKHHSEHVPLRVLECTPEFKASSLPFHVTLIFSGAHERKALELPSWNATAGLPAEQGKSTLAHLSQEPTCLPSKLQNRALCTRGTPFSQGVWEGPFTNLPAGGRCELPFDKLLSLPYLSTSPHFKKLSAGESETSHFWQLTANTSTALSH